jgi:hypothetical protein
VLASDHRSYARCDPGGVPLGLSVRVMGATTRYPKHQRMVPRLEVARAGITSASRRPQAATPERTRGGLPAADPGRARVLIERTVTGEGTSWERARDCCHASRASAPAGAQAQRRALDRREARARLATGQLRPHRAAEAPSATARGVALGRRWRRCREYRRTPVNGGYIGRAPGEQHGAGSCHHHLSSSAPSTRKTTECSTARAHHSTLQTCVRSGARGMRAPESDSSLDRPVQAAPAAPTANARCRAERGSDRLAGLLKRDRVDLGLRSTRRLAVGGSSKGLRQQVTDKPWIRTDQVEDAARSWLASASGARSPRTVAVGHDHRAPRQ